MRDKMYRTILFDLDGTLTDSSPGILDCVKYALAEMEWKIPDETVLDKFLGPPLKYSFSEFCGMTAEDAEKAAEIYRSRYKDQCVIGNSLYDGIFEMLERLHNAGKILAVATTKPEIMAEKIVAHYGIKRFFTTVCGADPNGANGDKSGIIQTALKICGETDLKQALMIGDRFYDIEGAKSVGIDSIGALYGYGSREELEAAGADHTASSAEEIADIILK